MPRRIHFFSQTNSILELSPLFCALCPVHKGECLYLDLRSRLVHAYGSVRIKMMDLLNFNKEVVTPPSRKMTQSQVARGNDVRIHGGESRDLPMSRSSDRTDQKICRYFLKMSMLRSANTSTYSATCDTLCSNFHYCLD